MSLRSPILASSISAARAAWRLARAAFGAPTLSPAGLLAWAVAIAAGWGVLEILGWREYACVISGTSPSGNPADRWALFQGMVYVLVYFAGVLVAPVLAIAAGLMAVLGACGWAGTRRVDELELEQGNGGLAASEPFAAKGSTDAN